MKNFFIVFFVGWILGFQVSVSQVISADVVEVYVEQDGKKQLLNNNTVKINRKPFTLIFVFKQPEKYNGIYINTSFTSDYFKLAPSEQIPDFRWLPQKVFSEYKFNPNNELKVHSEFFQYWGYDKKRNWFKFNKIEKKHGKLIGYRKVENLDLVEKHRKIQVRDNHFPLFMFFTILEKNPGGNVFNRYREVIRFKGKIKFK